MENVEAEWVFDAFEIDRYDVQISGLIMGEPPVRSHFINLDFVSRSFAQNNHHYGYLTFYDTPHQDWLGGVGYLNEAARELWISVNLSKEDFGYYYKIMQTEKPVYFNYLYSSEVYPNTQIRRLYYASVSTGPEPVGEGTTDVSRALLGLESEPQSVPDRERLHFRLESLSRATGRPQTSTGTKKRLSDDVPSETQ